jgi:hypothetical protein
MGYDTRHNNTIEYDTAIQQQYLANGVHGELGHAKIYSTDACVVRYAVLIQIKRMKLKIISKGYA